MHNRQHSVPRQHTRAYKELSPSSENPLYKIIKEIYANYCYQKILRMQLYTKTNKEGKNV